LYVHYGNLPEEFHALSELPPKPPAGSFDVRFDNQHMLSVPEKNNTVHIEIQASSLPISVSFESEQKHCYEVIEEINNQIVGKKIIRQGEVVEVSNPKVTALTLKVVSGDRTELPQRFALQQNFPNPFNPSTAIEYDIARTSFVTIQVYNVLGQEVMTLVNDKKQQGTYTVEMQGDKLSSGLYFYQLKAQAEDGEFVVLTKKMVLIR
jgi:hypothetical protein